MANLNIRVDDTLKKQAETVFSDLGISLSTATTMFLKQVVRCNAIPFELRADPFSPSVHQTALDVPNAETLSAIDEVNNGNNLSKSFHSVAALMEDLNA